MDCNTWRMDFYLDMVDRPDMEEETQQSSTGEFKFYAVTDSNELPF